MALIKGKTMVDKTTSDTNTSTDNKDVQGDGSQPQYATAEQVNQAITNRNKSLEKQLTALTQLVSQLQSQMLPQEEPKKESELSKIKKDMEKLRAEREAEIQSRKDLELRSTTKDELNALGLRPSLTKALMAQLIDSDKVVRYNEDGQIVFVDKFGETDLKKGLKELSLSNDYKDFFTGKKIVGSGDRKYTPEESAPSNSDEAAEETLKAFFGLTKPNF